MTDPYDDYEMLEELGNGSFGVVYKAVEKASGELVAIKHIDLDGTDDDIQDIQQEISLLSTCSSPYVTRYKTSFVRGVKLWIVMEYLGGGSCLDLIKTAPFSENHAAIICRELLLALEYLHSSGKIHRDVKAANVLLSHGGKVKIADFGVAAQLTNIKSQRMTFVGTPFWMAPEVIQEAGYDFKADIWSLGITTLELLKGQPPNSDLHPMKALFHIPKAPAPRLEGVQFSREVRSFVAACLVKDPDQRPSARELLNHRWIQRAGRAENLRSLIELRQRQQSGQEDQSQLKYYEETLRDMSPTKHDDDWVFDTVKPVTNTVQTPTMKKRKLSQASKPSFEPPTDEFSRLDLDEEAVSTTPQKKEQAERVEPRVESPTPSPNATMMRVPRRRSSVATARKVSTPASRLVTSASQALSPGRRMSSPRQPLGVDMSFGNSPSTTRQFSRVSEESHAVPPTEHLNNENVPPPTEANSKESKLGRRVFAKAVEPAFQEVLANTGTNDKQNALSKVGQAWAALDSLDPEGEYLLFRAILERLQSDSRLSHLLISQSRPPSSSQPSTPQKPKLILAQNNPHLKSHRRRQSSQVSLLSATPERRLSGLPGQVHPGMEQTKQVTDALYGRWIDGMRERWPQV